MAKNSKAGSGVFPDSEKSENGQIVGIKDSGYLTTKGLSDAGGLLTLPPGEDIAAQKNADIRKMDFVEYQGGLSYPDDGWE